MRILLVHNFYSRATPSGENGAVELDHRLLVEAGVDVTLFGVESDAARGRGPFGSMKHAVDPVWGVASLRRLKEFIRALQPDVVHIHNVYPLISPGAVRVAHNVPAVVATVHNHRLTCTNGLFLRGGRICRDCSGTRLPWPAVRYRCWDGSGAKSLMVASSLALHRQTWRQTDRLIAVSDFLARELAQLVPDAPPVVVRPNPVPAHPRTTAERNFLFCGRLDNAKGLALLIDAWKEAALPGGWQLHIAGDGPLRPLVESLAAEGRGIRYLGQLTAEELQAARRDTAIAVVPSLALETQGLAVAEALAAGQPAVVSDRGALPEQIDGTCGWVCRPEPGDLARTLVAAASAPLGDLREHAVSRWRSRFEPKQATGRLLEIYADALDQAEPGQGPGAG